MNSCPSLCKCPFITLFYSSGLITPLIQLLHSYRKMLLCKIKFHFQSRFKFSFPFRCQLYGMWRESEQSESNTCVHARNNEKKLWIYHLLEWTFNSQRSSVSFIASHKFTFRINNSVIQSGCYVVITISDCFETFWLYIVRVQFLHETIEKCSTIRYSI